MPARKKTEFQVSPKRLYGWLLLAMFALIVSVWEVTTFYAIQKYSETLSFSQFRALVYAPRYLSANEDGEIRFAIENPSDDPVTVTVGVENNSAFPGFLGLQESSTVYSGTMQSHQQINRQLKVFFYVAPTRLSEMYDQVSKLSLWASIDNATTEEKNLDIYLAPIPLSKSLSNYLGTVLLGILGLLLRDLWDQVKKPVGNKR